MEPFRPTTPPAALAPAVLVPDAAGVLRSAGPAPGWFEAFTGPDGAAASAFLEHFLVDAEVFWRGGAAGQLRSGPWTEAGADGVERTLEAVALTLDGRPALLVQAPSLDLEAARRILTAARRQHVRMERMRHEVDAREVLLHCIVHDLGNPLASLRSCLELLRRGGPGAPGADEVVAIGLRQVERMQALTNAVLETFSDDVRVLHPASCPPEAAPDASAVATGVVGAMRPAAAEVGVALALAAGGPAPAVCDAGRLERVLANLVENAVRHSPPGGTVTVRVVREDGGVRLEVEDEGPGVPPEVAARLFHRFVQGADRPGRCGLGLYFCRIAVEGWGGRVAHDPAPGGGARFTVHLRSPSPTPPPGTRSPCDPCPSP